MVALFAGRNGANALNRYVDAAIDSKNPRTSTRHIPKGDVKRYEALVITLLCYALFVFAAFMINFICFALSPVALILFTLYSYTKRFTWACHIVLGITCAGAPVGAWLAVTGSLDFPPLILGAIVMLWVAGFDILYGTQDIEFDRKEGLYSIPAHFGLTMSLWIARGFHMIMWCLLILLMWMTQLSLIFSIGILISGILLWIEHTLVDPKHQKKMNLASYHLNQIISMLLLITATIDVFL
jgi:4-hydroxybenzoate polyprenyltransferase